MAKKPKTQTEDTPLVFDLTLNDVTLAGMVKRRAAEANAKWEKLYNLTKLREENKKLASAEKAITKLRDERYQDVFSDNIIFKAKRTILAFVTGRVSTPEVTPADSTDLAQQFAADFEKVLVRVGEMTNAKQKIKLANNDLLDGQRVGVLKWVYNADKKKLELIYCKSDSILIGSRSGYLDEPDFLQHTQKRTIAKLLQQFPDKKDVIYKLYGIDKGVPSQLEIEKDITENWIFVEEENATKLGVIFMAGETVLGKMSDPNWREDGDNVLDEHMMPFIFFNLLNDGTGWIDNTSFLEQAQFNQQQYNKRGETIAENANYAGVGVPVFAGGAIKEETAARVQFNPTQRIVLSDDATNVNNAFTTWQAAQLQPFVFEDKTKLEESIYDTFGTNQVQTAGNTDTNTLGEAVLMRNQAEGRQQEFIDSNDNSMTRYYRLEAQMIYRYFDEAQYFNILGSDGAFEQIVISQKKIAENLGIIINVKAGTNVPIDRAQKTAQALELAKMGKISTLTLYKELGVEDPEESYHSFLRETLLPFGELQDSEQAHYSREAEEDLTTVIGGQTAKEREDLDEDYITFLTDYLITNKYHQLPPASQQRVSAFIADVIAQAQRKQIKMQTQQPILENPDSKLPPVRAKLSLSGKDLQPDVLAQAIEAIGYKPSALTPLEMQAGIMSPPSERIDQAPIAGGQPAQPTQQP